MAECLDGQHWATTEEIADVATPESTSCGVPYDAAISSLHRAAVEVLAEWIARLRAEAASGFPERVTPFRPEMAVHGKFGQPGRPAEDA
jgi:hypothetical protein